MAQVETRRDAKPPSQRGLKQTTPGLGASDIDDGRTRQANHSDRASPGRKMPGTGPLEKYASRLILSALLSTSALACPVRAQIVPSGPPPDGPASRSDLRPGANSFTEGQAKRRLETLGYERVRDLRKDRDGIWRGTAEHGGRRVDVGLDYRGAVVRDGKEH